MMEGVKVSMDFVSDEEDVARMLFSPLFICDGILSQKAFTLEATVKETYISVLRPAIDTFKDDMEGIRKEGNTVYGYALLSVEKIRKVEIDCQEEISVDVLPRNAGKRKSHAGIFATIDKKKVRGGAPQTVARMLLRMKLVEIAQKRIVEFNIQ